MRILEAIDYGADGVSLTIHLDERRVVTEGERAGAPDPAWVWRTVVPAEQWHGNEAAALVHAGQLADLEARRRRPVEMPTLRNRPLVAPATPTPPRGRP